MEEFPKKGSPFKELFASLSSAHAWRPRIGGGAEEVALLMERLAGDEGRFQFM